MKNKIKLLPHTDCYEPYLFSNPTPRCKYVKILMTIRAFNARGVFPTRAEVQKRLGKNDPRRYGHLGGEGSNSAWAGLRKAGLISATHEGTKIVYRLPARGIHFLDQLA